MDFNILKPNDPENKGDLIIFDPLELFAQEIRVLFTSKNYDILGEDNDWLDLQLLVFETQINESELKRLIDQGIKRHCLFASEFTYTIDVKLMKGSANRDIAVITIRIENTSGVELKNLEFLFK